MVRTALRLTVPAIAAAGILGLAARPAAAQSCREVLLIRHNQTIPAGVSAGTQPPTQPGVLSLLLDANPFQNNDSRTEIKLKVPTKGTGGVVYHDYRQLNLRWQPFITDANNDGNYEVVINSFERFQYQGVSVIVDYPCDEPAQGGCKEFLHVATNVSIPAGTGTPSPTTPGVFTVNLTNQPFQNDPKNTKVRINVPIKTAGCFPANPTKQCFVDARALRLKFQPTVNDMDQNNVFELIANSYERRAFSNVTIVVTQPCN